MLENLDIVLAFTMIMLLLSLLATIVVQMVVSLLGLRGRNLFWAVERIVQQAAPGAVDDASDKARTVAAGVLGHEILSPHQLVRGWLGRRRPWKGRWGPEALQAKDLVLVMDHLRSNGDDKVRQAIDALVPAERQQTAADAERICELVDTLKETFPEQAKAIEAVTDKAVQEARGWAKGIEDWFEMAMDAAHERFKMWSRWITAGAAVALAFGFQINAIDILGQLSDQDVRAKVLSQVETVQAISEATLVDAKADRVERHKQLEKALEETRAALGDAGLTIFGPVIWEAGWDWREFGGSLVTALLLSLGAPFWYGTFKKLLGLRSIVAEKQAARSGP